MSLTNSPFWFSSGASAGGGGFYPYSIDQSLRFNDDDTAYLNRTFASAGNRKTWTFSTWVKRGNLGTRSPLLTAHNGTNEEYLKVEIHSTDQLRVLGSNVPGGTTVQTSVLTTQVLRDVSSWYHIVCVFDTTQATAADRVKLYLNGTQITDFDTATYPTQNDDYDINNNLVHNIGWDSALLSNVYADGYLAETHFIDGTALDATSFGETINGIWVPKAYSGSYGTNGFYFDFSDNSTASALGTDSSGNGNNFSVNNLATTDQVPDSPTNNFATLNPIEKDVGVIFKQGNLEVTTASGFDLIRSTFFVSSGKWYWEVRATDCGNGFIGVSTANDTARGGQDSNQSAVLATSNGNIRTNAISSSYGNSVSDGDIIGIALDMDNGKIYFAENNTYYNSGDPVNETNPAATGLTTEVSPSISLYDNEDYDINFGQDSTFAGKETAGGNADDNGYGDFKYAPPSGFLALCSANLPEPTIGPNSTTQSDDYFNTVLYTGNGTAIGSGGNAITGVGFQPDWVWIKERNGSASHGLYDVVRGVTEQLESDTTAAETTESEGLTTFGTDGFTVGSLAQVNTNTDTYVAWNWKAGGTAVSNTDGSITSSVSANTNAGFSIVSYTGNATDGATVGHGLSQTVEAVIVKRRDSTAHWQYLDKHLSSGKVLLLSSTGAEASYSTFSGGGIDNLGSTTFSLEDGSSNGNNVNASGGTYIAYCFHSVEGYSKVGSYVGNGNADGTFIYTGFRPAWVMVKRTDSTSSWFIMDTVRRTFNPMGLNLDAENSDAEVDYTSSLPWDYLSNGVKIRNTAVAFNASGGTYIYLAFAESPFKYANAR